MTYTLCRTPSKPHQNEVGRSNSGRVSSFRSIKFYRIDYVLGFCCSDFVTSTKTHLEVKIDLSASFWRDSFSGPRHKQDIMHSVYSATKLLKQKYASLNYIFLQLTIRNCTHKTIETSTAAIKRRIHL